MNAIYRSILRPAAAVLSLFSTATLVACEEAQEPSPEVIRSVITREVSEVGSGRERVFSGVAQSRSRTQLSFRVSGKILAIHVATGDLVEEGGLIAELDPMDFELSLREARASANQARAEERNADANYGRVRALYEREGVSRGELDQARASAESTKANADVAENRVRQAEQQLTYTKLRTPSSGAVSAVPADTSENIQAGEVVAVFQTGGPPEVVIAMPESLIPGVSVDDPVTVNFSAFPGQPYAANVREVGIAPGDGENTYPVTVEIHADWSKIRPGMGANVAFEFELNGADQIVLPASAVGHDRNGHFVFRVEPEADPARSGGDAFGMTQKRYIEVAEIFGNGIAIESGIDGGDRIVTAGVPRIHDGLRVRILSEGDWP